MTPQELRYSIFKLALEGKLSKQNFNDTSAISFKNDLIKEKQKLISLKIIRKEKNEVFLEEEPFDIPSNWCWIRTGDCVSNKSGLGYNKENLDIKSDKMIRVFRGGNIFDLFYKQKEDDIFISNRFVDSSLLLKKNWIITPAVTSLEHVGKMALIDRDLDDTVVGGFVLILIPHINNDIFAKYLLYAFSSAYYRNFCRSITNKSGQAFYNLSREKMMNIYIPLPPLEEQKIIVAKIEELLPLVDRYEDAWKKLELLNEIIPTNLEKSIIQAGLKGKLVDHNPLFNGSELLNEIDKYKKNHKIKDHKAIIDIDYDSVPFEIPDNWVWCKLGSISSYAGSKEKVNANQIKPECWSLDLEDIEKETGKIITICKAKDKKITGDKTIFKKGQILYSKLRPYLKKILIAPNDGVCSPELVPFDVYGDINCKYLMYVLKSPYVDNEINAVTYGVKMPRVGTETMVNLLIPLPPVEEQERIVAKIEELLPLCRKLIK